MRTQHYEVVIVGGSPSAAAIAALLAKRGVRGLIIDQGEHLPGFVDLSFLEPRSAAHDALVLAAGLAHDVERDRRTIKPAHIQVVYPDRRIELSPDRGMLGREATRRLGAEAPVQIDALLERLESVEPETSSYLAEADELPPPGFFARKKALTIAKKWARAVGDARPWSVEAGMIGEALTGFMPFLTHRDPLKDLRLPTLGWARLAGRVLRGLIPFGVTRSLRDKLLEQAERAGFERYKGELTELDPSTKPLRFNVGKDSLSTDILVDGTGDLGALRVISKNSKALDEILVAARPRGRLHAIGIELDRSVVPPALGDHALLLNGRRDTRASEAEDRPILLIAQKAGDPTRARFIAAHPVTNAEPARLEQVMRHRLERLIPFLSEGHPVIGPAQLRPHPLFDGTLDPYSGVAGVSFRTPYKHVYAAGPAILPGLGAEGEHLAALMVTEEVLERLGKTQRAKTLTEQLTTLPR